MFVEMPKDLAFGSVIDLINCGKIQHDIQNWTSKVVPWVTLMNSGPNKLADAGSWWPEWVEAIVAGIVFKKSHQQCKMTANGSKINKHMIQVD